MCFEYFCAFKYFWVSRFCLGEQAYCEMHRGGNAKGVGVCGGLGWWYMTLDRWKVTINSWKVTGDRWHVTGEIFQQEIFANKKLIWPLFTHLKRFSVSCMRDYSWKNTQDCHCEILKIRTNKIQIQIQLQKSVLVALFFFYLFLYTFFF